ncbi:MAG: WGxxGxxG-CTERM domain-containing protein [Sphingomonas sp.]|nr:WGxxGxxG-CTERM domain-containing protein [Sphingomonas sp.]
MFKHRKALLISTALLLTSASPTLAQDTNTGDVMDVTTNDTVDVTTDDLDGVTTDSRDGDDDDGFDWGLLGLLGLAGLLGVKRREPDLHRDTTTGTTTDRR